MKSNLGLNRNHPLIQVKENDRAALSERTDRWALSMRGITGKINGYPSWNKRNG